MKKLVILDLNGTVLDDWPLAYAATTAVFRYFGVRCPSFETCVRMVAHTGNYHTLYERHGISAPPDDLGRIFTSAYHRAGIPCISDGVVASITTLRRSGAQVHLLTAAREDLALPTLKHLNLVKHFDMIHTAVKAKGAAAKRIMEEVGCIQSHTYMVGDLPADAHEANRAGARGIAFINEHIPRDLFSRVRLAHALFTFNGLHDFVTQT